MRQTALLASLIVSALLLSAAPAAAVFGTDFDPGFNAGQVIRVSSPALYGGKSALQPDGKLVVISDGPLGGGGEHSADNIIKVSRFNVDGTPDLGFGTGGTREFHYTTAKIYIEQVEVQPDGKIAMVGALVFGSADPMMLWVRLNADGSDDIANFNGGVLSIGSANGAGAMAVLPGAGGQYDVLAGGSLPGPPTRPMIQRAHNGLPVASFDSNIAAFSNLFPAEDASVVNLAIRGDGRIVALLKVGGDPAVAVINEDGTLDTSFRGTGYARIPKPEGSTTTYPGALLVRSDGRIVIGGMVDMPTTDFAFLHGLNAEGNPDPSFNNGAISPVQLGGDGSYAAVRALEEYRAGRVIVGGSVRPSGSPTDDTFIAVIGTDGRQTLALPSGFVQHDFSAVGDDDTPASVHVRPDGRILVSGRLPGGYYVSSLAADQPPLVTITSPKPGTRTTASSVTINFTIADDSAAGTDCTPQSGHKAILKYGLNSITVSCTDGSGNAASATASVRRLFTYKVSSPKGKKIQRKKLRSIAGSAAVAPTGTKIALQRIDKKLLKKKKRCLWLRNNRASFKSVKAGKKKKCDKPVRLKAKVSGKKFNLKLKKKKYLPKGSYKLTITAPGAKTKVVSFKVT